MRHALNNFRGMQLGHGCWVADLELTDDFVLLGEELATVQSALDRIVFEAMTVGLGINTSKTTFFASSQDPSPSIHLSGDTLERVLYF